MRKWPRISRATLLARMAARINCRIRMLINNRMITYSAVAPKAST